MYYENIIYIFYKARYLNEEVNYTELSTSDSIPCQYAPRLAVADPVEAFFVGPDAVRGGHTRSIVVPAEDCGTGNEE